MELPLLLFGSPLDLSASALSPRMKLSLDLNAVELGMDGMDGMDIPAMLMLMLCIDGMFMFMFMFIPPARIPVIPPIPPPPPPPPAAGRLRLATPARRLHSSVRLVCSDFLSPLRSSTVLKSPVEESGSSARNVSHSPSTGDRITFSSAGLGLGLGLGLG